MLLRASGIERRASSLLVLGINPSKKCTSSPRTRDVAREEKFGGRNNLFIISLWTCASRAMFGWAASLIIEPEKARCDYISIFLRPKKSGWAKIQIDFASRWLWTFSSPGARCLGFQFLFDGPRNVFCKANSISKINRRAIATSIRSHSISMSAQRNQNQDNSVWWRIAREPLVTLIWS